MSLVFLVCIFFTYCSYSAGSDIVQDNPNSHKPVVFGATYMTLNNPFFGVLNDGIKEVIEANGDILITRDPAQDPDKQNDQIEAMIKENVKLIFINPVEKNKITSALKACHDAGIPVINVDTLVEEQQYVVSAIESDNYYAGELCAKDLMEKRENAKIVILNSPVLDSITKRVQGFMDTIADNPAFEVVYIEATTAECEAGMDVMSDILDKGIQFDVVFAGNDPTALGALAALQQKNKDYNVLIYGVDGSPDAKMMIQEGYIEGSASQSPKTMGITAAEIAYDYLRGDTVDKHVKIPGPLISLENLDQFEIHGWQ